MRGAATKSMSDIVEERQQSRCPPAAAPLRAAARRPAGFVARSSHTQRVLLVARASPAGLGASSPARQRPVRDNLARFRVQHMEGFIPPGLCKACAAAATSSGDATGLPLRSIHSRRVRSLLIDRPSKDTQDLGRAIYGTPPPAGAPQLGAPGISGSLRP